MDMMTERTQDPDTNDLSEAQTRPEGASAPAAHVNAGADPSAQGNANADAVSSAEANADVDPSAEGHAQGRAGTNAGATTGGDSDIDDADEPPRRRRLLASIAVLPTLVTVSNGLLGFSAIHYATRETLGTASLADLERAAWLIAAAMLADMLDGRIARMTRRTSDFGGQLDSLCDVISFGVAPAMLMLRTVIMLLRQEVQHGWLARSAVGRAVWCIAAVYVACAVLRLARFNVENEPDESAHLRFEGLPSPGAAAAVVAAVLLLSDLVVDRGLGLPRWLTLSAAVTLPLVTLAAALLMVSRVPYPHLVNQYIRNRSRWRTVIGLIIVLAFVYVAPYITVALFVGVYVLGGLLRGLHKRRA
jgi:CDP-diacylglycerol--serine O-phosphatidyltransferase